MTLLTLQGQAAHVAREERIVALADVINMELTDGPLTMMDLVSRISGHPYEVREAVWRYANAGDSFFREDGLVHKH